MANDVMHDQAHVLPRRSGEQPSEYDLQREQKDVLQEQWALDLNVRIQVLYRLKLIACAEGPASKHATAADGEAAKAVEHFLQAAGEAITPRSKWVRGRSPLDHWRGISVVTAYENVHAAETFLVDLLTDDQIRVLMPSVVARAQATLDADDPRRQDVDALNGTAHDNKICKPHFKQAMRAGFQAEDQTYLRIRTFRNLVLKCTALLFVFMAVVVWLVATHPESMPLCFTPGADAVASPAPSICPSGDNRQPSPEDIMIVAGLGLLGSAAAAAFSIRGVQGIPTPYDIAVALAVFKLPLGAFTAVTGLLLLGGNFVPGLSELDSQRQILAYALTLGYAQQLVSRLIDTRARMIVSHLPTAQRPAEAAAKSLR